MGIKEDQETWFAGNRLLAGHIIASIVFLVGIYADNQAQHSLADKRITVIEMQLVANNERNKILRQRVEKKLDSIERKIDKFIERELNRIGE